MDNMQGFLAQQIQQLNSQNQGYRPPTSGPPEDAPGGEYTDPNQQYDDPIGPDVPEFTDQEQQDQSLEDFFNYGPWRGVQGNQPGQNQGTAGMPPPQQPMEARPPSMMNVGSILPGYMNRIGPDDAGQVPSFPGRLRPIPTEYDQATDRIMNPDPRMTPEQYAAWIGNSTGYGGQGNQNNLDPYSDWGIIQQNERYDPNNFDDQGPAW